jgi:hypothetical protein
LPYKQEATGSSPVSPKCNYICDIFLWELPVVKVIVVITNPSEVNKILECLKRNNTSPFDKGALKAS